MKKIIALTIPGMLFLTGCMNLNGSAEVNSTGKINGTFTYTLLKSDAVLFDINTLDQFKATAEQGGTSCTSTTYLEDNQQYKAICQYINASPAADKRISVEPFIDSNGKTYYTIWYRQNGEMTDGSCWDNGKRDANGNAIIKPCKTYNPNLNDSQTKEALDSQLGTISVTLKLPGDKAFIDWDSHGDTVGFYPQLKAGDTRGVFWDTTRQYVTIKANYTDYVNLGFVRDPNPVIVKPTPIITIKPTPSKPIIKTITCIKGKLTKKVTGISPKCPTGYKVK